VGSCSTPRNVENLTITPLKFTEDPHRIIQREFYSATMQFDGNCKF
jgi:hypothetical protein